MPAWTIGLLVALALGPVVLLGVLTAGPAAKRLLSRRAEHRAYELRIELTTALFQSSAATSRGAYNLDRELGQIQLDATAWEHVRLPQARKLALISAGVSPQAATTDATSKLRADDLAAMAVLNGRWPR